MIEIIIFAVFFGGIVIGSLIAQQRGLLPTAKAMEEEDQVRDAAITRE